jgi:Protein of unknown function (DUF4019)
MLRQGLLQSIARGVAIACVLGLPSAARAAESPEDAAQKAAESWLALVDSGKYPESWDEAASLFKGAMTREQWTQTLKGVRDPLGKLQSRKIKSRQYAEKLPGAPDGKYVILQFDTVYEHKTSAIETVTPMLDKDGSWRVSGYYLK